MNASATLERPQTATGGGGYRPPISVVIEAGNGEERFESHIKRK